MKKFAYFVVLFALWALLTWPTDVPHAVRDLGAGLIICLGLAAVMGHLYPKQVDRLLSPKRWFWFLLYVPYFLYYCIRANLDVAFRVIHPDVPIRPGIVKVTTTLTGDLGKTLLANSITLTPGTLTVDVDGQDFYVHWINVETDDPKARTEKIVRRFERILKEILE